jgi:hypothetical protein
MFIDQLMTDVMIEVRFGEKGILNWTWLSLEHQFSSIFSVPPSFSCLLFIAILNHFTIIWWRLDILVEK